MLVLCIDTSGRNGTLTLARQAEGFRLKAEGKAKPIADSNTTVKPVEIVSTLLLPGGEMVEKIVASIDGLLKAEGVGKKDLTGIVVVTGPGSFTGLRVGLAAAKAL